MVISKDTADRLLNGAKVLGDFWRRGDRCSTKWASSCGDAVVGKPDFCKAKLKWVTLALSCGSSIDHESEYAVIEAMMISEFEASGLTMLIEHPTHGRIKVGPKEALSLRDLTVLADAQDQVGGTLKVLEAFPGAMIDGTAEPE